MVTDDMALVREYAQSNSEQAFAELVSQYINLVYSVALRQVSDHHLAEEVTQAVFVILARKAKSLSPKTILSSWLCRTARNVSADALKIQRRRQFREQKSQMQTILNEPEPGIWNQIAPLLDAALNCLGEKEHNAVVLRFFDNKELKHVGAAMGITEDAARMRVNRGLEKLRQFFTKRGVTLSAAAIAGAVASNSVQAAPAGLAAAITAAALSGTTITTAAVIAATKAIAMTTLQKAAITALLVATVGTGTYEGRQAANARADVKTLQQQQAPMTEQIQQLQRERDESARQFASLPEDNERLNRDTGELLRLRGEVGQLRNAVRVNTQLNATNGPVEALLQDLLSSLAARIQSVALASITAKYPSLNSSELAFDDMSIKTMPDGSERIDVFYALPASAQWRDDAPEKGKSTLSTRRIGVNISRSGQVQSVYESAKEETLNSGQ